MIVQMKDVAERAGVSLTTASFVLNKKRGKSISRETAKRVWQAARELNYHVNVHARRLARGQSNLVGLIISEIANPFFPDVIRGFELAATHRGLELLLCNTEYQAERMEAAVSKMLSEGVRGVAIMTSTFGEKHLQALAERRIPVVLLSIGPNSPRTRSIELDFTTGMFQAIDYLVNLGHSSFGVISGPLRIGSAATTRDAFIHCLNKRGLSPKCVLETDYRVEGGMSAVRSLVHRGSQVIDQTLVLQCQRSLRRFLLHLLPRGFMRIRNFGFLANRRRAELLPLCLRLLQPSAQPVAGATSSALPIHSLWQCPLCGGTMQVVERLSAAQLLLRSPSHLSRCTA